MNKKKVIVSVSISILIFIVIVSTLAYLAFLRQGTIESGFPDFKKPVYINAKYAQVDVTVQMNPDYSCTYELNDDPLKYKGTWEISDKGKSMKIKVDLTRRNGSENIKINRLITLYDSKNYNNMASVPVQFMKGQYMLVYGKWKQ